MSIPTHQKIIAVDFDGTIVKDEYPKIGEPQLFAFETLRKLEEGGYRLILWTLRDGKKLEEAVEFCKKNGITFYAINKNYPEEVVNNQSIRKLHADIFIDDRNIGGFMGWGKIYQLMFNNELEIKENKKKGFLGFFK